jgi:hypothetical protein
VGDNGNAADLQELHAGGSRGVGRE